MTLGGNFRLEKFYHRDFVRNSNQKWILHLLLLNLSTTTCGWRHQVSLTGFYLGCVNSPRRSEGLKSAATSRRAAPRSRRVASRRVASRRVASHRIASHRIASHRIASHRIASHRIASHRIARSPRTHINDPRKTGGVLLHNLFPRRSVVLFHYNCMRNALT